VNFSIKYKILYKVTVVYKAIYTYLIKGYVNDIKKKSRN